MKTRLDHSTAAPEAFAAMLALSGYIRGCGLDPALIDLVQIRASQLNHCAFCLDLHVREARERGVSEQRLHLVAAWRESPLYTPRERAALAWAESLTLLAETGAPDDVYEELRAHFTPGEQVKLTLAIGTINAWNRLNVGFRTPHPVAPSAATAA